MDVIQKVEEMSQGFLATSTHEVLGITVLTLAIVGLVGFMFYALNKAHGEYKGEGTKMVPPVQLRASDKGLVVDILTSEIEHRVLFKKLNRKTARRLYDSIGRALDIPELRYTGDLKSVIKSQRAYRKKLNGNAPKLPLLPGEKPIQDIKPNVYADNSKKARSFFKTHAQAKTA